MPFSTFVSCQDVFRRLGTPEAPRIIDVRIEEDFLGDPRFLPASRRVSHHDIEGIRAQAGQACIVVCQKGLKLSQGVAAWLRSEGRRALSLSGGFDAWRAAGLPLIPEAEMPPRGADGRTLWVTRERPKIDRIACPWLIRRFIDRDARFLFVAADQVMAVAERFAATPFDVEGARWSHVGEECSFDTMIRGFGLESEGLLHLARIVRGADTARLDLAPESAGLLAISLGLSYLSDDDQHQLEAGIPIYDALYSWCCSAKTETHNWPSMARGAA